MSKKLFATLSDGATVYTPMRQTFWPDCFGMLKDRFGVPWRVSSEQLPP